MTWLRALFGWLIYWAGVPQIQRPGTNFLGAGVSIADNPGKKSTDITIAGASSPSTPVVGSALQLGPAGQWNEAVAVLATTDGTTHNLTTIPIPSGSTIWLELACVPNLAFGTPNANAAPSTFLRAAQVSRGATGLQTPPVLGATIDSVGDLLTFPFVTGADPGFVTPGPGQVSFNLAGNNLQLQVTGHVAPQAWQAGHAYNGRVNVSATTNVGGLIGVTTATAHGLTTGAQVYLSGIGFGGSAANGWWLVTVIDATHVTLNGSTFGGATGAGGILQPNPFVTNGGNVYFLSIPGTSAGSGGPTGTGAQITDNGCTWTFVAAGSAVPITWTATLRYLVG